MRARLEYSYDDIMAERPYARRIRRGDVRFHGGLNEDGTYVPPRSLHRRDAIRAWTERLRADGLATRVIDPAGLDLRFFPSVDQAKLLLRRGANGAMTRILTLIGITEGFGNDGIRAMPRPQLQPLFAESIAGTCLDHLYRGLLDAHGNDEAGCHPEAGHDGMWYAIRDAALGNPTVTPDMFENLPIAPPPGYVGPAKPSPEAIGVRSMELKFPTLDPMFEVLLLILTQLLVIELVAFGTFTWAKDVLRDPECSLAPEFAPRMVDYVTEDESIHVAYLQCALAEVRSRTLIGSDGGRLSGAEVIDSVSARILSVNRDGNRRERLLRYRMDQIRRELGERPDGGEILAQFQALGPIPA